MMIVFLVMLAAVTLIQGFTAWHSISEYHSQKIAHDNIKDFDLVKLENRMSKLVLTMIITHSITILYIIAQCHTE